MPSFVNCWSRETRLVSLWMLIVRRRIFGGLPSPRSNGSFDPARRVLLCPLIRTHAQLADQPSTVWANDRKLERHWINLKKGESGSNSLCFGRVSSFRLSRPKDAYSSDSGRSSFLCIGLFVDQTQHLTRCCQHAAKLIQIIKRLVANAQNTRLLPRFMINRNLHSQIR